MPKGWSGGFPGVCDSHQHADEGLAGGEAALVLYAVRQGQRRLDHTRGDAGDHAGEAPILLPCHYHHILHLCKCCITL